MRAKKTQVVLHNYNMIYVHVRTYVRTYIRVYFAFTYDDRFQQHGCISSIELRNS